MYFTSDGSEPSLARRCDLAANPKRLASQHREYDRAKQPLHEWRDGPHQVHLSGNT